MPARGPVVFSDTEASQSSAGCQSGSRKPPDRDQGGVAQSVRIETCRVQPHRLDLMAEPGALALGELARAALGPRNRLLEREPALDHVDRLVVAHGAQRAQ